MDAPNPHPSGPARLKTLLTAAGLTSCRLGPSHRGLIYPGRTRNWLMILSLNAEWLHAYVVFCDLPREAGVRARLFEAAMSANGNITLASFATKSELCLELNYRAEHLDAGTLGNLTTYLHTIAEKHCPHIFRIVSGDEALDALAERFQVPEAAA